MRPVRPVRAALAAAAALLLTAGAGCEVVLDGGGAAAAPAELGQLEVAPETHAGSYERDAFGQRWKDMDRNGCGQRDDVLARDLAEPQFRGRCVVVAGVLTDPYDGSTVEFRKADAEAVQIDHVVALAEAWRSGAWDWTAERREEFANDLANLVASSGPVNQAKSDHDAREWLPEGIERSCTYVAQVLSIKAAYRLSVDEAEASAIGRVQSTCPKPSPSASASAAPAAP